MKTLKTLAAVATLAGAAGTALAANDVSLSPASSTVMPGDPVVLTVDATGFADLMLGGGLNFSWDPDVLDLNSVTIPAATWEFARNGGLLDPASGTLSGMFFSSFAGRTGDFPIATLSFTADKPGTTTVTMSLMPTQPFANDLVEVVSVNLHNATVTAVPEPGTWALFALGGGLLPLLRRRQAARR